LGNYCLLVDFADLFPGRDVSFGPLTVVTLSQKTKNDMSGWSENVEYEREELVACVRILRSIFKFIIFFSKQF